MLHASQRLDPLAGNAAECGVLIRSVKVAACGERMQIPTMPEGATIQVNAVQKQVIGRAS